MPETENTLRIRNATPVQPFEVGGESVNEFSDKDKIPWPLNGRFVSATLALSVALALIEQRLLIEQKTKGAESGFAFGVLCFGTFAVLFKFGLMLRQCRDWVIDPQRLLLRDAQGRGERVTAVATPHDIPPFSEFVGSLFGLRRQPPSTVVEAAIPVENNSSF